MPLLAGGLQQSPAAPMLDVVFDQPLRHVAEQQALVLYDGAVHFQPLLLDAAAPPERTSGASLTWHPFGSDNEVIADAQDLIDKMASVCGKQIEWRDPWRGEKIDGKGGGWSASMGIGGGITEMLKRCPGSRDSSTRSSPRRRGTTRREIACRRAVRAREARRPTRPSRICQCACMPRRRRDGRGLGSRRPGK